MDCADDFFKFLCRYLLENRHEDMKFISKRVDKTVTTRLEATASNSLLRFSYTEAISLLQKATTRTFETKPKWGVALTEEHLRYVLFLLVVNATESLFTVHCLMFAVI